MSAEGILDGFLIAVAVFVLRLVWLCADDLHRWMFR
jgi:hypothetical protein